MGDASGIDITAMINADLITTRALSFMILRSIRGAATSMSRTTFLLNRVNCDASHHDEAKQMQNQYADLFSTS